MKYIKLIVAGGRDFRDRDRAYERIDRAATNLCRDSSFDDLEIVSGMAKGADRIGVLWAVSRKVALVEFPADWNKHKKSAGYVRNAEMAGYGTHLLVFWDGKSKGTLHMINLAKERGLPTVIGGY